ncbi:MAG: hypothetical protein R2852_02690 [Bacteroidia bacterium]
MKTKSTLHTLLILLFLSLGANSIACPIWLIGQAQVVDENGVNIPDAQILTVYHELDTILLSKPRLYNYDSSVTNDTNNFQFWSGYYSRYRSNPTMYYIVKAKGYADVKISEFNFISKRVPSTDDWMELKVPLLKITMYHNKFIQLDDQVLHFTKYEIKETVEVKDTTILTMSDYLKDLKNESDVQKAERLANASIKTYPNPVIDELKITVTDDLSKPFMAKVTDITRPTCC